MKDLFINEQFIAEESSWLLIMGAEKYRFACVIFLGLNIMCGVSCDCFKVVVGVFFWHNQWMTDSIKVGFVCLVLHWKKGLREAWQ